MKRGIEIAQEEAEEVVKESGVKLSDNDIKRLGKAIVEMLQKEPAPFYEELPCEGKAEKVYNEYYNEYEDYLYFSQLPN